jgi:hypothetical protein
MGYAAVIALTAERISAAFDTAIRTDRSSTVSAPGHGGLAAGYPHVAIGENVFDLARGIHTASTALVRENQDELSGQCLLPLSCHPLSGCEV